LSGASAADGHVALDLTRSQSRVE